MGRELEQVDKTRGDVHAKGTSQETNTCDLEARGVHRFLHYERWELYLTQLAKGDVRRVPRDPDTVEFLCADHWCSAFTFGELADDIAKLAARGADLGEAVARHSAPSSSGPTSTLVTCTAPRTCQRWPCAHTAYSRSTSPAP